MVEGGGMNLGYPFGAATGSPRGRRLLPNLAPELGGEVGAMGVVFRLANRFGAIAASLILSIAELTGWSHNPAKLRTSKSFATAHIR